MRSSWTASGGTHSGARFWGREASASAVRRSTSSAGGSGPQSATRPATTQKASKRSAAGCGASTRRAPAWVARRSPPRRSSSAATRSRRRRSRGRALELQLAGGRAHLLVEMGEQRRTAVAVAAEERQRGVEAAAVEVRVEVAEARRQASPHLAVGRGVLAARQPAPAVAQREQRVEVVRELARRVAAAQRADADREAAGRLGRHLEHRIGDVEAAAQVDVGVGVLEGDVAGRAQSLDQPVLQHERAELGLRRLAVHDRRMLRPRRVLRGRREVRARAAAHRGGLADVQRSPAPVAERVHARPVGEAGEVERHGGNGHSLARAAPGGACARAGAASEPGARPRRRPSPRGRRASGTGRRRRARTSRRRRARGGRPPGRSRASRPAGRARGGARAERSAAPGRPCTARAGRARAVPARSNAAASTRRSKLALWATSTRPRSRSASRGSTRPAGGAASTMACEMPVKRWIPGPSGARTATSDSKRSCSSPPPTSTAPTSVSSQSSPAQPLVSTSTARNSAVRSGDSSVSIARWPTPAPGRRARVLATYPAGMTWARSTMTRVTRGRSAR